MNAHREDDAIEEKLHFFEESTVTFNLRREELLLEQAIIRAQYRATENLIQSPTRRSVPRAHRNLQLEDSSTDLSTEPPSEVLRTSSSSDTSQSEAQVNLSVAIVQTPTSPRYCPNSPRYSPTSPAYSIYSYTYNPTSPTYSPTSPAYSTESTVETSSHPTQDSTCLTPVTRSPLRKDFYRTEPEVLF